MKYLFFYGFTAYVIHLGMYNIRKVTSQNNEELIGVNISVQDILGLGSHHFNGDYQISLPQDVTIYYFNTSVIKTF